MKMIKEMIVSAVFGMIFVIAVTILLIASEQGKKLEDVVYRRNRFERILTE